MAAAAQEVRKALLKVAHAWPKNPLRPELDFGEAIKKATETQLAGVTSRVELAEAQKSLAALERLRSSASLHESILHPASSPNYYTQLVDAMGRVSRGESVSPSLSERMRHFFGMTA